MGRGYLPSADVPSTRKMVNKLLRIFDKAGNAELEDGALWYPRALETATAIAELHGVNVHQVAAIMSIVSPGTGWKLNKLLPAQVIEYILKHGEYGSYTVPEWFPGYPHAWQQCRKVLIYGDITISGRKTLPFYSAIMGDENALVVDRHMVRICSGVDGVQTCSDAPFRRMQDAIRQAAEARGVSNRTMQATVWICYRRYTVIPRLGRTIESVYDGNPDAGEEVTLWEEIAG
jgi:hypothetical protein